MRKNRNQGGYILLLVPIVLVGITLLVMRSMSRAKTNMRVSGAELNYLQTGFCTRQCGALAVNSAKWKMDNNQSVAADTLACSCNPEDNEDIGCSTVFTPRKDLNVANCYGSVVNTTNIDIKTSCAKPSDDAETILENVDFTETPIFQFAAFFEKEMDISPGPQMDIAGRIHSNDVIRLFPNRGPVLLHDWVTAYNEVQVMRFKSITGSVAPYSDVGFPNADTGVDAPADYNPATTPKALNTVAAITNWDSWQKHHKVAFGDASGLCGKVEKLVIPLRNPDNPHAIIEWRDTPSPDDFNDRSQKFAWRADLVFKGRGNVGIGSGPTGASSGWKNGDDLLTTAVIPVDPVKWPPASMKVNHDPGATSYRVRFWDARDTLWVRPIPIDLSILLKHRPFDSVVYLYDSKIDPLVSPKDAGGFLLYNGAKLPHPLTIVSNSRVYMWGDFNTDSANVVAGVKKPWPAAVICDGYTQLSNEWDGTLFTDTQSPIYGAAITTVNPNARCVLNACVMTGTGSLAGSWAGQGGYQNLLRYMEDWGGAPLEFSGAGVCLWSSQVSTGLWYGDGPNRLYLAPTRVWNFDSMYKKMANMPPATPRLVTPKLNSWEMTRK